MMRVALISEHASPLACLGGADGGGQNVYVAHLARQLGRMGHSVDIFTRRDDRSQDTVVEFAPNTRVIHVPAGPPERFRKEDLLPYMGDFTRFLARWARRGDGYDILHANFFMSALVACDARRALGTPVVVTFHALGRVRRIHQGNADAFPEERLAIEDRVVAEADRIIAECPQDQEDLTRLYQADHSRLRIAPCGFDPDEFHPMAREKARSELRLSPGEFVVLQLGRLVPRKGVDNVIRGIGCLRRMHGIDARLLIVGGESRDPDPMKTPELGRLMSIARDEQVLDRVTFVGSRNRSELRTYYGAADVFVTTPWYEPFGITPLEAMACGTPVVGAAVGGIQYSIRDGQTGFLVPPKDVAALADRLAVLARDRSLLQRMGQRARLRAIANFTWARVAEQIAHLYGGRSAFAGASVADGRSNQPGGAFRLMSAPRSAVFLDKDGTLVVDVPNNIDPLRIRLGPGATEGLALLHRAGFQLVVVTNQPGVAYGLFEESALAAVRSSIVELLKPVPIAGFYYCPHGPADGCVCRKPEPGMLRRAAAELGIDLRRSWMIGDILNDIEAGRRAGCRTVLIDNGNETEWATGPNREPHYQVPSLIEAAQVILCEET